jgi:hypothetical protein
MKPYFLNLHDGGVGEWRSGGVEEWGSGGVEEWRSGGVGEWRSADIFTHLPISPISLTSVTHQALLKLFLQLIDRSGWFLAA